jgi:hypothetical protein
MGNLLVAADEGNVCFGSGKDCWAFTLTKFARIYAKKFNSEMEKLRKKFWGDYYFDAKNKKWIKDEVTLRRQLVLQLEKERRVQERKKNKNKNNTLNNRK